MSGCCALLARPQGLAKIAHMAATLMKRKEEEEKRGRKVGNVGAELGMNRGRKERFEAKALRRVSFLPMFRVIVRLIQGQ